MLAGTVAWERMAAELEQLATGDKIATVRKLTIVDLHFARILSSGEIAWRVHEGAPAGRLLGIVAECASDWRATGVVAGKLRTRRFADRDAAARWLITLAAVS